MKHKQNGFTLVEVTLFLAVSGLLIIGVMAMTGTSIAQQRFNDATQSFAEFLRSVYSEVMNPQSIGNGRSDLAVYGKMITFGEEYDLAGQKIEGGQKFFVYDVVGDADHNWGGGNTVENWLKEANVVVDGKPAGIVEEYIPKWGSAVDSTENGKPFKGTILILRQPQSGTVSTFVSSGVVEVNRNIKNGGNVEKNVQNSLKSETFGIQKYGTNFCINMEGYKKVSSNKRRNVRIIAGARNTSGVELIDLDSDNNECK